MTEERPRYHNLMVRAILDELRERAQGNEILEEVVDEITEDLSGGEDVSPPEAEICFRSWATALSAFYGAGVREELRRSLAHHLELCFHRAYSAGLAGLPLRGIEMREPE